MENCSQVSLILCAIVVVIAGWLVRYAYRWSNPPCNAGRLPPGSMGFPLVGETFQLLRPSTSLDVPVFYRQRLKRYGSVFKTNLLGQQVVVSMDSEVNRTIFQQEGKLYQTWFPGSTSSIFGTDSIASFEGSVHKFIRSFVSRLFGIENIKDLLLAEMDQNVAQSMAAWATEPSVEINNAVSTMIFDLTAKKLIGFSPDKSRKLRRSYDDISQGIVSFPMYFPGTKFYRCMQARKNVKDVLTDLLKERLATPEKRHGDFLDEVVQDLQSGTGGLISEKFAVDVVAALLFASYISVSSSLTVAMKYLSKNPKIVQSLKEEHNAILKKRDGAASSRITWEEYKSMSFTAQVTNEITRIVNVAPGIFKRTLTDVKVKGYTIPAGWMVLISPMSVHLDPELFEDPLAMNPWRWQDESKRSTLLKNFMPFGGGLRHCVGAEFTKAQIALFLHSLVTKYRWKEIKGGEVQRVSEILMPMEYHIQMIRRKE